MKKIIIIFIGFIFITTNVYAVQKYKTKHNPFTNKQDYVIDVSNIEAGDVTASGTVSGVTIIQSGVPVGSGSGAPTDAHYYTDQAETGLSAEVVVTGLKTLNGIAKGNGSGAFSAATEGSDYLAGTRIDDTKGNGDTAYTWSADKSFDQFALKGAIAGQVWTGVHDFGGADSLEVPNAASLTLDAAGEVGVNSTHKGFAWYDGTQEVFEPSIRTIQFNLGTAEYDTDPDVWSLDLDADTFPHGIYFTKVYVDCNEADPTTELNADLKYCDAVGAGAFPGANAAVIKALDTTTGNMSDTAVNTAVSAGKTVYVTIDADPTSDTTLFHVKIQFYVPES